MRRNLQKIIKAVSGERAFHIVEEIASFHRIQASMGYRKAANYVKNKLRDYGFDTKLLSYPADGKTWFYTQKMFKEWDCRQAVLKLENEDRILADFSENNLSVIQRSYPCDFRKKPLDIVLLEHGNDPNKYKDIDLKGKLIFVRDDFNAYMDWAVKEKGAVGFVTDYMREIKDVRARYDLFDTLNYTSFWWKHTEDEPETFGFVLTPREGDRLAEICRKMKCEHSTDPSKDAYPKGKCFVDADIYDGEIEIVDTVIPGELDEEVLIVAHLCHPKPSANDNASGVAASIEAINVLKDLISSGELEVLKRSIRILFLPEFTGTFAYLSGLGEGREKIKAGINMDMVGGLQTKGYGPLTITGLPHATPFFSENLTALVMDEVKSNVQGKKNNEPICMFNASISSFDAGSDHFILSDPGVNIPTIMLSQWPDIGYHTGADTTDKVDPFLLHKSASICAGFIYHLANLSENNIPLILNNNRMRFIESLGKEIHNGLEESSKPESIYENMEHLTGFYRNCNQSLVNYMGLVKENRLYEVIQKEDELLMNTFQSYWKNYQKNHAPGFEYKPTIPPEDYRNVPTRNFITPLLRLNDYILDDPLKKAAYNDFCKNFQSKLSSAHKINAFIGYYMDGNRNIWDIAKETTIESGEGSPEYVLAYTRLLESFDLVTLGL